MSLGAPDPSVGEPDPRTASAALAELRTHRRRKRVEQIEWFEAAYRVYLTGILSTIITLGLASILGGDPVGPAGVEDVRRLGPALIGLVAAAAVALGLRSGSRGGPLAVEPAEVRHVLLAPVPRATALRPAAWSQLRHAAFVGAAAGGLAGFLAHRRLPGATWAWLVCGMVVGATLALALVGSALLASGSRLPRWAATALGGALLAWAAADLAGEVPAPSTMLGSLALWPLRVRWWDVAGVLAVLASVAAGLALLGRVSVEALERRTALVGQLRFAVTVQDLRTVIVLRRQLALDLPRQRPWLRLGPGRVLPVWRRGWQGILRFPLARIGRLAVLGAAAGLALVAVWRGTGALVLVAGLALFVAGLDAIEPLAQQVDQADRTDALPMERGVLLARHAPVGVVVMLLVAGVGLAAALAVERTTGTLTLGAVALVPAALCGGAGAAISTVMGAPAPSDGQLLPPEVAGMKIVARTAWPLVVSVLGTLPVLVASRAEDAGSEPLAVAVQAAMAGILVAALTGAWLRYRDQARAWWSNLLEESQRAQQARKGAP